MTSRQLGDPITFRELQVRVGRWCKNFFEYRRGWTQNERVLRIFEEAVELMQAAGLTQEQAIRQVQYTYRREPGEVTSEMAGVMIGICSLAELLGQDLETITSVELARINKPVMKEKMREKVNYKIDQGISLCAYDPPRT